MKTIKQAILDKLLYIGEEIPEAITRDKRSKFVLLGNPQELIDEVEKSEENKKETKAKLKKEIKKILKESKWESEFSTYSELADFILDELE